MTGDQAERLIGSLEALSREIRILREAVDDLREEYAWAMRHREQPAASSAPPLTSLPLDPLAPDFGERINRVTPQELPPHAAESPGRLF